jgi:hypothetical protein
MRREDRGDAVAFGGPELRERVGDPARNSMNAGWS